MTGAGADSPDDAGGLDGRGGPHVLVGDLETVELDDDARHHLQRVLRLRPGDPLTVFDGEGRWRPARFGETPEPTGPVRTVPPPSRRVTVAVALLKGNRPELVVQKLTELGVDEIVLFDAEHGVVRWAGERRRRHLARLEIVARAACEQSRRCRLPTISDAADLAGVAATHPGLVRAERGGPPPAAGGDLAVAVGPEGGWSAAEADLVPATMGVARHVLRAETAAIAVAAVLDARRAGLV